jgi:hypothetical protein
MRSDASVVETPTLPTVPSHIQNAAMNRASWSGGRR